MKRIVLALLFVLVVSPLLGNEKEGGIIGTGVVGKVTGVGRWFEVSGMQFMLPPDTALNGIDSIDDLDMGMTLAMRAEREGDGWRTTSLRHIPLLVGPVTGRNEVMGVSVEGDVPPSGLVSVDGFWSPNGIVASRIEIINEGVHSVSGPYDSAGRIGTVPLKNVPSHNAAEGDKVIANGNFSDGTFVVETMESNVFGGTQPDLILTEGFPSKPDRNGQYELIGTGAKARSETSPVIDPSRTMVRCVLRGIFDFDPNALDRDDRSVVVTFCPDIGR